jgi:DNA polymerase/3'-5' exonuclease PolX
MHKELLEYLIHLAKLETNTSVRARLLNTYSEIKNKKLDITKTHVSQDIAKLVKTYQFNVPVIKLQDKLLKISGMTSKKAYELANKYKKLQDIPLQELSIESRLHLQYTPNTELPNILAKKMANSLLVVLKKLPDSKIEIAGSLRRGEKYSKDIDIVIGYDGYMKNIADLLQAYYKSPIYIYSEGESKMSFITSLNNTYFKADIIKAPIKEFYFQLIYLTGSKEHNIIMRRHSKYMGYLLNQKGIYKNNKPQLYPKSERDIYKFLNLEYVTPANRIHK